MLVNLDGRFPADEHMEAFDCVYPSSMPACDPEDAVALQALMDWGLAKLATLAEFYGTDRTLHQTGVTFKSPLDAPKLKEEFEGYKTLVVLARAKGRVQDEDFWAMIVTKKATALPNMAKLVTLMLVQALTTSCCERGLSVLGLTKTKLRNRLNVTTCSTVMEINLNGPALTPNNEREVASLLEEAFELWHLRRRRNANKAHFVKRPRKSKFVSRPLLAELADGYNSDAAGADAAEAGADAAEAGADEAEGEVEQEEETEEEAVERQASRRISGTVRPGTGLVGGCLTLARAAFPYRVAASWWVCQ